MTLFSSLFFLFFFFESVGDFVRSGDLSALVGLVTRLVLVWRGRGSGRSDNPVMEYHGGECRGFSLAAVHRFYPEYNIS